MKKNILKWFAGLFLAFALFVGCEQSEKSPEDEFSDIVVNTETATALNSAIKDVETVPETKEEFEELVGEVLKEYMFATVGGGRSRMVSPTGTPLTDVDKIFDELKSIFSEVMKNVGGEKETFTLKKSVNIGEISYKDWIKLIFDLYDEVSKEMGDEFPDSISIKQDLLAQLNVTEEQLNDYATELNKYSKIHNFYVDADIKQSDSELKSKMKLYESLGVTDFNALLGVFFPDSQFEEAPVKSVYAALSYDYSTSMSSSNPDPNNATMKAESETVYKIAVCTADKKGGIITFNSKASANLSDNDISNLNNNAMIKISVEGNDGKKKSFYYTYDEFSAMIQSLF